MKIVIPKEIAAGERRAPQRGEATGRFALQNVWTWGYVGAGSKPAPTAIQKGGKNR